MTNNDGFISLETKGESIADAARRTMQSQLEMPKINIQMMLSNRMGHVGSSERDHNMHNSTMLIPSAQSSQQMVVADLDKQYNGKPLSA